jgi:hypothetical protein
MLDSHRVFLHGNTNMFLGQSLLFHLIVTILTVALEAEISCFAIG